MNFNDISSLLHSGATPDEIAEAFTANLNAAIESYELERAEALTPCEALMEDLDVDGYTDDYFESWTFNDYCELLSLVWNRMIMAYNKENNTHYEHLYLSVPEAQNTMRDFLNLCTSPVVTQAKKVVPKCRERIDQCRKIDVSKALDDFETTLREFIKNL